MPRRSALALVVGTVVLALAACSGGGGGGAAPADGSSSSDASPSEPVLQDHWPLTGLALPPGKSAARTHPVIVLKMDNTYASAPQLGLGSADLVVEELVEGGLTRLAAFFYTDIPGVVGPVRSMRASDIGIVSPVDASVVTSGAASVTIARIRDAGIQYFNEGSKGFFRDDSRSAPYNLFTDLKQTATLTEGPRKRPDDYLTFGPAAGLPAGEPATSLVARFGSGHATEWRFEDGTYVNDNSYAAADDQFRPDTVLALHVQVGDAGYLDPAGNPVPETKLSGGGEAEIFSGGRRIKARWSKDGLTSPIVLRKGGQELAVPVGHTWIELVPDTTGEVTFAP